MHPGSGDRHDRLQPPGPWVQSYRDPFSHMSFTEDRAIRYLGDEAAVWFREVESTGLLRALVDDGLILDFEVEVAPDGGLVLASPRLPFVTYPVEWTWGMLQDAALATLEIVRRSWDRGVHVRDASAFNIVFDSGRPVFVDHGSFRPGHTPYWLAYGQFCDHFLNPLALGALTDVSHRIAWSSSLEGLPARELRGLLGRRALRHGLFRHVYLRAALDRKGDRLDESARSELRTEISLPAHKTHALMDKVERVVSKLHPTGSSEWVAYEESTTYSDDETAAKESALEAFIEHVPVRLLAVDVGANTGAYSAILSRSFDRVVAVDGAEGAAEVMYQRIKEERLSHQITPVVADIADPTPGRGILGAERRPLLERLAGADLYLWLAVIHHLVITRSVPLTLVARLAADLGPRHIVEHVGPGDPMSRLLLSSKADASWPLDRSEFEEAFGRYFEIASTVDLTPDRTLYLMLAHE